MRIDIREARIAFSHFCYALAATAILIALFDALVLGHVNRPRDCAWQNKPGRSTAQGVRVDWHCANSGYIATH